ncbi:MAG: EamA family transporter RarD [Rhizobiaceae bacterium]
MTKPTASHNPSIKAATETGDTRNGFKLALLVYFLWGFLPFYMKAVAHIPTMEVLMHRIVWSVPIAGVLLWWLGRTDDIRRAIREPRTLAQAAMTASIIAINWFVYVWSIANGRALETALGYYINPLFSVFLGAVILGEKLDRTKMLAIALATSAVIILSVMSGGVPWVSIVLTVTWGFYALFKRTLPVGPAQGFFLETAILFIPAASYLVWQAAKGQSLFLYGGAIDSMLLTLAGVVTAVPLIIYAYAAKGLKLSTIGIMQYIAPSMIFVIAVFIFNEPFDSVRLLAFVLIWCALAIYSWSLFSGRKR